MNENEVELQSKLAVISIPSNVEEMIILYKVMLMIGRQVFIRYILPKILKTQKIMHINI